MFVKYFLYPAKEALRPIGLIPRKFLNRIMLMFLEKYLCIKRVVAMIFRHSDNKAHCCQEY